MSKLIILMSKWRRIEYSVYGYTFLLFAAFGGYGWYTGNLAMSGSESRTLFFVAVLGSLLFFWRARRARKRRSEGEIHSK